MSGPPPIVDCRRLHPTLRVTDILTAVEYYTTRLGFTPGFTWGEPPTFAGVNLGDVQVFLEQGPPRPGGATCFVVGDADELFAWQRANGVEVVEPPEDREYGLRDYTVRDPDGNCLTFGHHVYHTGPSLEVERVDVPVRLERRLAALLEDLAKAKRMTVTSCLEETLLHTFEGVGPHTAGQLRLIQQLKEKHGIDYDSHASYRFVESARDGNDHRTTAPIGALGPLTRQFDIAWSLTAYHLDGLTTAECLWRPATRGLHVHQAVNGRWVADWPDHEGYDLGPPSIAWVTWHMGFWWSMVLDHSFGDASLTREAVTWPGTADGVRAWLGDLEQRWRGALAMLTDDDLRSTERCRWPFADRPFGDVVAWATLELTKNAAELGYARFLYAVR